MTTSPLLAEVDRFPTSPGIYIMKSASGAILYIGKALNLRSRVRSYFFDTHNDRPQIPIMLEKARAIEWIATNTENEALILEANLIRTHKPPYNVDLKDDKHYPYLKITIREPFPRLVIVRRVLDDGAVYFGPYTDAGAMRRIADYGRRIFRVRDCSRNLPLATPAHPCINFSMGRCSGACAARISQSDYRGNIERLILFLKGKRTDLLVDLEARMQRASVDLDFETAAAMRDQIALIRDASRIQRVDLRIPQSDLDVFGVHDNGRSVCLAILHFREGLLMSKRHFLFGRQNWEASTFDRDPIVVQFYGHSSQDDPSEVLLPEAGFNAASLQEWFGTRPGNNVTVVVPHKGAKRQLVALAEKNAELYLIEKAPTQPTDDCLELQKAAGLPRLPNTIEAFDISNLGGAFTVAGMSRFEGGRPDKAGYRRYKIKSVEGQDDFAMMLEVVGRRLDRLTNEKKPFPDLVLIDGGKGQLSAAQQALARFENAPMIISLAKQEETIFSPYVATPVQLPANHPGRKLVERVRDEVHRFAISYHRLLRGKQFKKSVLEDIPGIGDRTARLLLLKFGSVKRIREASIEELATVRGITPAAAEKMKSALGSR